MPRKPRRPCGHPGCPRLAVEGGQYCEEHTKTERDRYNRYAQVFKGKKGDHTISLMTLVDIALMYEREKGNNDTAPYDTILKKLTSEIDEALK